MCHYEGEMSLSYRIWRAHGQGRLTCYAEGGGPGAEDISWIYEGQFHQGHATGQGRTTYGEQYEDPDLQGYVYFGAHVDGNAHGQGTWYYPGGAVQYVGDHQHGEYQGQGISYRHDGTREYEGTWHGSCWRGNGILYRPDGSISREGEWVNGDSEEYEWQGETCWYEGDWDEEGSAHGWGILYRPDRITVVCEGWWQNGEPVDGPPPGDPDAP